MGSGDDADVGERVRLATGADLTAMKLGASSDPMARLREDVAHLREHPLIVGRALVGGFLYDVDTGALTQVL